MSAGARTAGDGLAGAGVLGCNVGAAGCAVGRVGLVIRAAHMQHSSVSLQRPHF